MYTSARPVLLSSFLIGLVLHRSSGDLGTVAAQVLGNGGQNSGSGGGGGSAIKTAIAGAIAQKVLSGGSGHSEGSGGGTGSMVKAAIASAVASKVLGGGSHSGNGGGLASPLGEGGAPHAAESKPGIMQAIAGAVGNSNSHSEVPTAGGGSSGIVQKVIQAVQG